MNAIHAIEDLRQRANKDDPEAQYDLGWRYSAGHGVPRDDVEEGFEPSVETVCKKPGFPCVQARKANRKFRVEMPA